MSTPTDPYNSGSRRPFDDDESILGPIEDSPSASMDEHAAWDRAFASPANAASEDYDDAERDTEQNLAGERSDAPSDPVDSVGSGTSDTVPSGTDQSDTDQSDTDQITDTAHSGAGFSHFARATDTGAATADSAPTDSATAGAGATTSSAGVDSAGIDSANLDSGNLDPGNLDPGSLDPVRTDLASADLANADLASTNPAEHTLHQGGDSSFDSSAPARDESQTLGSYVTPGRTSRASETGQSDERRNGPTRTSVLGTAAAAGTAGRTATAGSLPAGSTTTGSTTVGSTATGSTTTGESSAPGSSRHAGDSGLDGRGFLAAESPQEAAERRERWSADPGTEALAADIPDAPKGRGLAHVGSFFLTLLLVPVAWYLISDSGARLAAVADNPWQTGTVQVLPLLEIAGGFVALAIIWLMARTSSLGAQIVGALVAIAGIAALVVPAHGVRVMDILAGAIGDYNEFTGNVVYHLSNDLGSGRIATFGLLLFLTGLVAHGARRHGERAATAITRRRFLLGEEESPRTDSE